MERMALEAKTRAVMSKGERRELRNEDQVLGVIYGRGDETLPLVVDGRTLRQVLATGGSNVLLDLKIKARGKKTRQETAMFKDIQRDILQQEKILHVDFVRISMTDKIEVSVHLNFTGEPAGINEGGVLSLVNREVDVKCLPGDIPEQFDIDISDLGIGDSISAGTLDLEGDIELITPLDTTLVQVLAPMAEEEPEPAEEEIEGEDVEEAAEDAATEEATPETEEEK